MRTTVGRGSFGHVLSVTFVSSGNTKSDSHAATSKTHVLCSLWFSFVFRLVGEDSGHGAWDGFLTTAVAMKACESFFGEYTVANTA